MFRGKTKIEARLRTKRGILRQEPPFLLRLSLLVPCFLLFFFFVSPLRSGEKEASRPSFDSDFSQELSPNFSLSDSDFLTPPNRQPAPVAEKESTVSAGQPAPLAVNPPPNVPAPPKGSELMQLNITWGGGEPRCWQGSFALSEGLLLDPVPLGNESDIHASYRIENGRLLFAQRGPRRLSGVQIRVFGPMTASLQIRIAGEAGENPIEKTVPLQQLIADSCVVPLDNQNNRLSLHRSGGDELAVLLKRPHLVFFPNETVEFEVFPRFLAVSFGESQVLEIAVFRARTEEKISGFDQEIPIARRRDAGPIPIVCRLPQEPGVYDIVLSLNQPKKGESKLLASLPSAFSALTKDKEKEKEKDQKHKLAERVVQCVVLSPKRRFVPPAGNFGTIADLKTEPVAIVDPGFPEWWKAFAKTAAQSKTEEKKKFLRPDLSRWTGVRGWSKISLPWSPGAKNDPETPPIKEIPLAERLWSGPLGSGHLALENEVFGTFASLKPSGKNDVVPWEAYSVPVQNPNLPHLLEIEYISNRPQTLGISIVEPMPDGTVVPLMIDSGLDIAEEIVSEKTPERVLTHRIVFWPKTEYPMILLTNRQNQRPATFGKIKISRITSELPRAFADRSERLFAGYLHRPCFSENFSAGKTIGEMQSSGVSDWVTFYDGATRLAEYLQMVGYGGAMISVAADGSSIYPSDLIRPTPKYDNGIFQFEGEDPVRKDVLELLARIFDREELTLIPAIDFSATIEKLEQHIRADGRAPGESGLSWVGPEGQSLVQTQGTNSGRAPYYNLLNPIVQEAVLEQIRELLFRYGKHPSFGGIAIQLSPDGFAQLPEEYWGMDDETIRRFQSETRTQFPEASGPERFAVRFEHIRSHCLETWVHWRAKTLGEFYLRMSSEISRYRNDAKLYFSGASMLDGPRTQGAFYPSFSRRNAVGQSLVLLGFDLAQFEGNPAIVFPNPKKIAGSSQIGRLATQWEMEQSKMDAAFFRYSASPGTLFYNRSEEIRIPSFEEKSPYQPTRSWFALQAAPSEEQNRKRFVRQLAEADCQMFFDGGRLLSLGQEEALIDMIATFRRLPKVPFRTFVPSDSLPEYSPFAVSTVSNNQSTRSEAEQEEETVPKTASIQPLTIRYAQTNRGTFLYVLNNAPFHLEARVVLSASPDCKMTGLNERRPISPPTVSGRQMRWTVSLRPYDLIAVRLSDPQALPLFVQLERPETICGKKGALTKKLDLLIKATNTRFEWSGLLNPDFELPSPSKNADETVGWERIGDDTFSAKIDSRTRYSGNASLKMSSPGTSGGMISNSFEAPASGRLFVNFWLGVAEDADELPLRLALTGWSRGTPFLRTATIGPNVLAEIRQTPAVDGMHWRNINIQFTNLPLSDLSPLAIRLDLTGRGTVWVDEVRMQSIALTEAERTEMMRLISVAGFRQSNDRISDAITLLEGFWPRLLLENATQFAAEAELSAFPSVRATKATPQPRFGSKFVPENPKPKAELPEPEPTSFFDRIRSWFPQGKSEK